MKIRSYCLLLSLVALPFAQAFAACSPKTGSTCVNQSCDTVGLSELDGDQKNVLVCLKNDSGALVWKSSTSGGQNCTVSIVNYWGWGYSTSTVLDRQVFSLGTLGGAAPYLSGTNRIDYQLPEGGGPTGSYNGYVQFQCLGGTTVTIGNYYSYTPPSETTAG